MAKIIGDWQEIELDAWVVMPNHFHGIVMINNDFVWANKRDGAGANGDAKLIL